jgi:hypothetical protein
VAVQAYLAGILVDLIGSGHVPLGLSPVGLLLILGGCGSWVAVEVPSSGGCRQECGKDCYNRCGPSLPE